MRHERIRRLFALTAVVLLTAAAAAAQWSQSTSPLPAPTGMVNDYAGVLDAGTKQQIEQKLRDFRDSTSPKVEIAVAIVKTTRSEEHTSELQSH